MRNNFTNIDLEPLKLAIEKAKTNSFYNVKDYAEYLVPQPEIDTLYSLLFYKLFKKREIEYGNYIEEIKKINDFNNTVYYQLYELIKILEYCTEVNNYIVDQEFVDNIKFILLNKNSTEIFFDFLDYLKERDEKFTELLSNYSGFYNEIYQFEIIIKIGKKDFSTFNFDNNKDFKLFFTFLYSNNLQLRNYDKKIADWILDFGFKREFISELQKLNFIFTSEEISKLKNYVEKTKVLEQQETKIEFNTKQAELEKQIFSAPTQEKEIEFTKKILEKTEELQKEQITNNFLTLDPELEKQNKKEYEFFEKIKELESKINSVFKTNQNSFSLVFDTCMQYFDLIKTGDEQYLIAMEENYEKSFNPDPLLSKNFCGLIYLTIYLLYSAVNEKPLENINNNEEYNERQKGLKGIKSLPGYLEINQIKHEPWKAKAKFAEDSEFFKLYACFYNFYTKQENPFNETLDDKEFEFLQELAIRSKKKLETPTDSKINKILNEAFYNPIGGKGTHSIYTYTNILADFFKELNEPVDFELLENFGISLIEFLKNLALEVGSSVLLEFVLELFSKELIKMNGKKYSLLGIYNELYTLKKIFFLLNNDESGLNDILYSNINEISNTLLNDSALGQILKEEGYLALSGFNLTSTLINFSQFFNQFGIDESELKNVLYSVDKEGSDTKKIIWNLKDQNLSAWITVKFLLNKESKSDIGITNLDFTQFDYFSQFLNTLSNSELSYCFLCSFKNQFDYLKSINKLLGLNYTEDQLEEARKLLPNATNDEDFSYYENYKKMNEKFNNLLKLTNLSEFREYLFYIKEDIRIFSNAARYNYNGINQLILKQENTPLMDLILRILPTTRLLFGTFGLPLDKYLEKILNWFDEMLFTIINFLKKLMNEQKLKFIEQYKRERLYLLKNNWEYRIRAFNILLDVIFLNFGATTLCLQYDYKNDKEILENIYKEVLDKVKENLLDDLKEKPLIENPVNPDILPVLPNIPNDKITDEEKDKIKDKIDQELENKVVIVDKEDLEDKKDKTPPLIITPDKDKTLEEIIEESKKKEVIVIPSDEKFLEWLELEKPGKVVLDYDNGYSNLQDFFTNNNPSFDETKKDIYFNYVNKDLNNLFLNNTSNDYIYSLDKKLSDRYLELNDKKHINFSDAGYHYFVDFKVIKPKLLMQSLNNFDLKEYEDIKQTSLEFFSTSF